jgi:hypothetical protein
MEVSVFMLILTCDFATLISVNKFEDINVDTDKDSVMDMNNHKGQFTKKTQNVKIL